MSKPLLEHKKLIQHTRDFIANQTVPITWPACTVISQLMNLVHYLPFYSLLICSQSCHKSHYHYCVL